ncbi:hypothetical protein VTH06DRAFT_1023 [Thermothelomyces fergusii]
MTTPIHGALPPPKPIRFVNNQGQPPSKRRRINAACLTCRKRKTRCAGEKPDCSTCKKNGHVCLGYNDLADRKKESREDDGAAPLKSEPGDTPDVKTSASACSGEGDNGEQRQRLGWATKAAPRQAGFVDQDAAAAAAAKTSVLRSSTTATSKRPHEAGNGWERDVKPHGSVATAKRGEAPRDGSFSEDGRGTNNRSPVQLERHRVPYFRYFGPTAIVPGFKQMVVNVYRDSRRKSRGSSFSTTSPGSLLGYGIHHGHSSKLETTLETLDDLPVYDVNSSEPDRFLRMLKEKRIEAILVDAVCSLAARFSEQPIFTRQHDGKLKRSEYGHVFAQRAKAAIVDTFPCPSVAAVQACLLMAYEGFGADQDSALWMYLGIAIRMAVDLGLQKIEGVKYQGERDPWYTRYRKDPHEEDEPDSKHTEDQNLGAEEQQQVEQERIDTFWSVFVLDRVISSGTGRPVTFRDGDYELSLPPPTVDPVTQRPDPFPPFVEIIHLYGRASDVLNNIRNANDLTEEKMHKLRIMEHDLTAIYQKQDQRLDFNAVNFREYVNANQGTTFILLHFWFHALVIILHQPTLLTPFHNLSPARLLANSPDLPNSRELSMSSAKTIADILAFAELIDPKSLIANPFTTQPIYIAACAFLMESVAYTSQAPSREASATPDPKSEQFKAPAAKSGSGHDARPMKHQLLASAANQNYQRCYKSLQQLEQYWGGVRYILAALDQKSKGIWDCETFINEDLEAMKMARRGPLSRLPRFEHPASPNVPPIAYSLTGTTNSPNSNLTVLFQGHFPVQHGPPAAAFTAPLPPQPQSVSGSAAAPPGNMIYDPIRQSLPEAPPAFPPAYLQPNVSAVRYQPPQPKTGQIPDSPAVGKPGSKYESSSPADVNQGSSSHDVKPHMYGSRAGNGPLHHTSYNNHHSASIQAAFEALPHNGSPSSTPPDSGVAQQHAAHGHGHDQNQNHAHNQGNGVGPVNDDGYEADFAQSGLVSGSYSYMGLNPINETITFNSQEVNFDMLGLQGEMMPPWLEILPGDVLGGLFEGGIMGGNQQMG